MKLAKFSGEELFSSPLLLLYCIGTAIAQKKGQKRKAMRNRNRVLVTIFSNDHTGSSIPVPNVIIVARMDYINRLFLFRIGVLLLIWSRCFRCDASMSLRGSERLLHQVVSFLFLDLQILGNLKCSHPCTTRLQDGKESRIIGGHVVNSLRYPYFSLMWGSGVCGGVLIAPDIVLSAAHCW